MRIVHFAPFVPWACGLYEAARDMFVADLLSGHEVYMVDVGATVNGAHVPGEPGKEDDRGGSKVISSPPETAWKADVIVAHTGIPDNWISPCQAPIIWVMHGRPRACFSPEYGGNGHSYSLIAQMAKWPRVKAILTFWPYHVKFWQPIIPPEKLVCFPAPPIDAKRFSPLGNTHNWEGMGGQFNILICESWREDVDTYEIVHGALELAKMENNFKIHLFCMETNLKCWTHIIEELRRLGVLGQVWARRTNIEDVYRASDILLSPQRIVTRSIGEALCCGLPVVANEGCEYANYTARADEPEEVARTLQRLMGDLAENREKVVESTMARARAFSLSAYSAAMNDLYKTVLRITC